MLPRVQPRYTTQTWQRPIYLRLEFRLLRFGPSRVQHALPFLFFCRSGTEKSSIQFTALRAIHSAWG